MSHTITGIQYCGNQGNRDSGRLIDLLAVGVRRVVSYHHRDSILRESRQSGYRPTVRSLGRWGLQSCLIPSPGFYDYILSVQNALEFISRHRQDLVIESLPTRLWEAPHSRCEVVSLDPGDRGSSTEYAFGKDPYPLRGRGPAYLPLAPGILGSAIERQEDDHEAGFPANPFVVVVVVAAFSAQARQGHRGCLRGSSPEHASPAVLWVLCGSPLLSRWLLGSSGARSRGKRASGRPGPVTGARQIGPE